jgi:hypothetical protein
VRFVGFHRFGGEDELNGQWAVSSDQRNSSG